MLPQIKRPAHDDGEVEIEVVDVRNVDGTNVADDDPTVMASNKMFRSSAPPRDAQPNEHVALKPSHMRKGVFGDEPTQLMPARNAAKLPSASTAPPSRSASVRPNAFDGAGSLPEARGPSRSRRSERPERPSTRPAFSNAGNSVANPNAQHMMPRIPIDAPPPSFNMRDREDSHTMLRPLGDLSDQAKQILAESKSAAVASSLAVPSAGAIKAQVDAARAKRLADQRQRAAETLEVSPVSISERFVVKGRPTMPWAIAFAAMGILAVTTAAVSGGRASAIAAFIDPARETSALAAAAPQSALGSNLGAAAPLANDPAANLLPGANAGATPQATGAPLDVGPTTAMTSTVFAVGRAAQTQAAAQPTQAQQIQPVAPTPVAVQPRPTPKADPAPHPAPVAKADPKPDPKPASDPPKVADNSSSSSSGRSSRHAPTTKKPTAAGGGDVDSAAAADALAKAQLENSL